MSTTLLSTAATLLLFALSVLVLLKESRQGRVPLAFGLLLTAVVELLDPISAAGTGDALTYMRLVLICKSLLPVALLVYGMSFTKKGAGGSRTLAAAPLLILAAVFCAAALMLPMDQFYAGPDAATGKHLALGRIGYWYHIGLMIFCVAALTNLESVFAGIRGADRWRLKYEFLGVGTILAIMIFHFSQGLLYKALNLELLPVRSGVVIVASLLIGYSRLYQGRTSNLAVSRQAIYRSFTLVAIGLYFLVLGLLGEAVRWFDIPTTQSLPVFIAILSGLAFMVLLLSEEIRRRLRVFITKHFYTQKHDYREEWLGFSNALVGCHSIGEVQAAIVDRYHAIFGLRYAMLYAREGAVDSFSLVSTQDRAGAPARVTLTAALLRYFAETGRVLNPDDGEYTPTAEEAAFLGETEVWLLVPLLAGERLEAFVVLGRQVVPERLTYEDFDLMKILGRQAVLSLQNFRLTEDLAESREMAAVAKVSSFVIHDLKNLAYTFSLMMENAEEHIGEADFQKDLVKSIRSTVAKMNALIIKLKAFPQKQELRTEAADIALLARETLEEVRKVKPVISFRDDCSTGEALLDAQEMKKVVLNLLLNACDALGEKGSVVLRTGSRNGEVFLRVEDNGSGMSKSFVENHLFRPFRTTKEKGLGIGLYQCKQIVEAHGGRIELESREGEGTTFTVVLPGFVQGA